MQARIRAEEDKRQVDTAAVAAAVAARSRQSEFPQLWDPPQLMSLLAAAALAPVALEAESGPCPRAPSARISLPPPRTDRPDLFPDCESDFPMAFYSPALPAKPDRPFRHSFLFDRRIDCQLCLFARNEALPQQIQQHTDRRPGADVQSQSRVSRKLRMSARQRPIRRSASSTTSGETSGIDLRFFRNFFRRLAAALAAGPKSPSERTAASATDGKENG